MNTTIWNRLFTPCRAGRLEVAAISAAALISATAFAGKDNRAPDVPESLRVPAGQKVAARAFATGVQIYECRNISTSETPQYAWVFVAPEALLFADAGGNGEIGIHYGGPTWESESGSKVVGARVAGVTVDPTAIPWLLLRATSSEGPGLFHRITYIQRVHTVGGLGPTTGADEAHLGQRVEVPYTAVYYFFREAD